MPFVWWWNLDRANRVLRPPARAFDLARIGTIPYEDEIRAVIAALQAKKQG